jgi:hypothetical protein
VRKVIAIALSLAVQAALLAAPFVHAHPDDHRTTHHSGRAVHAHWERHAEVPPQPDGAATFGTGDHDRAVFLTWFVAVATQHAAVPIAAQPMFDLPLPEGRAPKHGIEVSHGHDPPFSASLPSRAPPASLS